MGKIVGAGAEIRLLRDGGPLTDLNFAKTVGVRAIAETSAIAQGEVPRNGNARALMHERFAFNGGAENVEPEKAPRVRRLRGPGAKDEPAKFPEQTQRAILPGPGRFLGRALVGLYRGFRLHVGSAANQAERQPRMNRDFSWILDHGQEGIRRALDFKAA